MDVSFIDSEKSKKKLLHDGHLFYKDKENNNKVYWRCEKYNRKCKARVITEDGVVVKYKNAHNHVGDAAHVDAQKVVTQVRKKAVDTRDAPNYIVASVSGAVSQSVASKLPTVSNLKRTIRNVRVRENAGPAVPLLRRDIVFSEEYTKTEKGKIFLMYDSGPDDDRILIFSTEQNLQLLRRSEHWHGDGTFKTVPSLFDQLYTFHGSSNDISIPLVYALLPNKRQETYIRLLQQIKNLIGVYHPITFMTDFEQAMIKAYEKEYPLTVHTGCFFHFTQCIWRHIQSFGLKQRYENDADFALKMRMLAALAFVPQEDVQNAFEALCRDGIFSEEMFPVVDYFEDTWIGRPNNIIARRQPVFSHQLWNCYQTVLQNRSKTNNNLEGWHRGFQYTLNSLHPGFWLFVKAIKREQSLNELKMEQYLSGDNPPMTKKKYRDSASRLLRVVSGYSDYDDVLNYLRAVAHNLSY